MPDTWAYMWDAADWLDETLVSHTQPGQPAQPSSAAARKQCPLPLGRVEVRGPCAATTRGAEEPPPARPQIGWGQLFLQVLASGHRPS